MLEIELAAPAWQKRGSILAQIGVILSIPSAVVAAMDLVDRMRKRKQAQALIDAAKQVTINTQVQISLVVVGGGRRGLDQLTADELLDAAEQSIKIGA